MPSLRSVFRALLVVAGIGITALGLLFAATGWGAEGFPAGLALVFGFVALAGGGGVLGVAALLSGGSLRPVQTTMLKLAGGLAVVALALPAGLLVVAPAALPGQLGPAGVGDAVLLWLLLALGALALAVWVGIWRAGELVHGRVQS
ncbi:hypothetical protein [Halobacterium jilantaiense]|uniref:Uncharacterized protein n=1 Tax=Halobacterium jilantaiense TaxID=355548 RepID=A0A1I0QAE7_9EURY|nr:hypothetical protein [Halobacterium jilantaiense]SEW23770.1 hypothetical protein SAMN04487945_2413 [Halobacterium jilantaiense]